MAFNYIPPKHEIGCWRPTAVRVPSNGTEMPSCQCHSIVGNTVGKWMRKLTLIKTLQDRSRGEVGRREGGRRGGRREADLLRLSQNCSTLFTLVWKAKLSLNGRIFPKS